MFAFKDSMAACYSRLSLYLQIHNCTGCSCQGAACISFCFGPQAQVKLHILDTLQANTGRRRRPNRIWTRIMQPWRQQAAYLETEVDMY
ncbi:hypothetical protein DUNSADRAFT_6721, partial [Dunaliella salina]